VQTAAAARAEERRLLAHLTQHGDLGALKREIRTEAEPEPILTFGAAVELFRQGKAVTRLKPSTRNGYEEILATRLLPRFETKPLDGITFEEVTKLDAEMVKEGLSASRRRNVQITIRSVLRAAVEAGRFGAMPSLPDLPKKGRKKLIALTKEQVERILSVSTQTQRIAFFLAAFAGLRAGEVRALRWADVDLNQGVLVVRFSESKGETSTPKSGHERVVPLASQLLTLLRYARPPHGRGLVSTTKSGQPWAECGLNQALKRAATKAGIEGKWRFHDLRHFFVTQLFRRGGGAPAVQALAGHLHLSTTQIYAHVVQDDLVATIGLLADRGNGVVTAPPDAR
jgi:integrase